ncbi:NitT/TauT family transport system permease protein/sulfonate transport system permease protein [Actinomadura hallensis]|uniref:NitT/TauT family transport system permease protein/sulfonate transport system permease protein n=1 Tax=Actinomadura hallensis TaxID=337895 RepID=A0A543I7V5_9ACTN|nr:ABC transporter permease subunit [Actinomadura hallensis]TQM66641.1 NitT/TauT family transport system permease protein/sulfonate transport system permease protein [Actinomadura hallensis]
MSLSVSLSRRVPWQGPLLGTGVAIAALLLWLLVSSLTPYIASPGSTLSAIAEGVRSGFLTSAARASLSATLAGFALASAVSLGLSYMLAANSFLGKVFTPVLHSYGSLPHIIFLPILLMVFGTGTSSKVAMAALVAVFPMTVNMIGGLAAVPRTWLKMGRVSGGSRLRVIAKVHVRGALPSMLVGLRLGFGSAFLAVVISEFFGSDSGLGVAMAAAYGSLDYAKLSAVVVMTLLISLLGNSVIRLVERRLDT